FTTVVASAADIDCKWTWLDQNRDGGPVTMTLLLKSNGTALTGTMDFGRGGPVEISEGKIAGDTVTFKVFRQPGATGEIYSGTISGGELKLTVTSNYLATGGK